MLVIRRTVKCTAKYHAQCSSISMCGRSSQGAISCISSEHFRQRWTTVRATCEDLPHINMDEHCAWYLAIHFIGLIMTNTALYLEDTESPISPMLKLCLCRALFSRTICSRGLKFLQVIYESFDCDLIQGFFWVMISFFFHDDINFCYVIKRSYQFTDTMNKKKSLCYMIVKGFINNL